MKSPPAPRKRNITATKARILEAAKRAFAELGYERAGLREIAAFADVNSALLVRYFGSKAGLFEAAMSDSIDVNDFLSGDRKTFGKRLAGHFVDSDFNPKSASIIAFSTSDDVGQEILVSLKEKYVIAPVAAWLGPPDATARAFQIIVLSWGFASYFQNASRAPSTKGLERSMIDWFAEAVQLIVDRR